MAIYLCHGIIRASDAERAARLRPIDLADELLVIVTGDLAAIASRCPDRLADGEDLETHVASADGIAALAVEHNRVVTEFAADADIVPLRLDSFYSSLAPIERMLATDAERLRSSLDRVAGRMEFAVRIERLPLATAGSTEQPTSGRDYLARRGRDRDRLEVRRETQASYAASVTTCLETVSDSIQILKLPDAAAAPRCLMRLALLVRRSAYTAFEAEANRLIDAAGDAHLAIGVTGPWAPYYFVSGDGA